ncbi:AlpA family transcriptional regulator [Arcobacter suis]|uniref:Transcriptional regulator, AlpA family n=1 Tax=Arcobacter suis CECT 7833 TaxID=663365 RepID=A0AAD0WR23_9BACT|nr:AlpA family phage regulatory protein [Arcobacter suis]AXX90376.1 putative transcriptional regulator, AlpA family [Arcobacter suis CECT 7833]RWS45413.1 AlpA family transcriptional regulator [Arcobacter suis]
MSNFLRIVKVMKKIGIAKSTIWLWVGEGKFHKPIKLSPRITIWEEEKVDNRMKEKL